MSHKLTAEQAKQALMEGKKIRREYWAQGYYWEAKGCDVYNTNADYICLIQSLTQLEFGDNNEFLLYEEPEPIKQPHPDIAELERYAIAALQAILASPICENDKINSAWSIAEDMLAERKRRYPNQ